MVTLTVSYLSLAANLFSAHLYVQDPTGALMHLSNAVTFTVNVCLALVLFFYHSFGNVAVCSSLSAKAEFNF